MACLTGARQHRQSVSSVCQERCPQPRHTSIRRKRQNKFKLRTTNRRLNCVTQSARQPRQWRHVGGKCWREWRRLRLCWVGQKLTHYPRQHDGPRKANKQTGGDARGRRDRARRNHATNGAFLLHQRARNFRSRQCQDRPAKKTSIQWLHAAGQHPYFPAALTPGRHLGCLSLSSATPTRWGRQRRSTSVIGRPPKRPPPRRQLHALWCLPVLGAPKSRIPLGWRNHGRQ